jgi:hypothetical protein
MKVKISEILELKRRMIDINMEILEDIEFLDDNGNKLEIDKNIIDEFKFTGLNNMDFISSGFYKEGFKNI